MIKAESFKIFLTNTITAAIILTVIAQDYEDLQVTRRPLPADMLGIDNKTEYEKAMGECMDDFVSCLTTLSDYSRNKRICAENALSRERKVFVNACDMLYDSCKSNDKNEPSREITIAVNPETSPGRTISKWDLGAFLVDSLNEPKYYKAIVGICNVPKQ